MRALSFTGSTEIGELLYEQYAGTVKRIVMELGGNAPLLVFADANMDLAVDEAIKAKFATSGQDCLGANRSLIARSVYGEFCQRFAARTATLIVGPDLNDPEIGPLMNEKAVAKQEAHVADALAKGGKLLTGGSQHEAGPRLYQPAVINNVSADALIMQLLRFRPSTPRKRRSPARMTTEYGLVAYIHTQDPRRIYRASRALQYGMVAINRTKVTGAPN